MLLFKSLHTLFDEYFILANFQIRKRDKWEKNIKKRGTFLIFLYITAYRFLQKEGHMVKSLSFLLKKEGQSLRKRDGWQVWHLDQMLVKFEQNHEIYKILSFSAKNWLTIFEKVLIPIWKTYLWHKILFNAKVLIGSLSPFIVPKIMAVRYTEHGRSKQS